MKTFQITLYLVCFGLLAGAQEPFSKLFEYSQGIYANVIVSNVLQAGNGDFIATGAIDVGNVGMTGYLLLVTDSSGNMKWTKSIDTYDYWSPSYESDIIQTHDNGFLFCGNDPYGNGGVLVKYDPDWNIMWNKVFWTEMNSVTIDRMDEDSAGNIYAYGSAFAYGPGSDIGSLDLLLMKLDANGNILEQVTVGIPENGEKGSRFLRLSSGDFILTGHRYDPYFYTSEEILVRLNTSFDVVWAKTMTTETQNYYRIEAVKEAADGHLLLAGNITDENFIPEPFMVKINIADGTPIWKKSYQPGSDEYFRINFSSIVAEDNGNITGTGGCYYDMDRTLIFRADETGEILWAKRNDVNYGTDIGSSSPGASIQKTASGVYIIAGAWEWAFPPFSSVQGFNLQQVSGDGTMYCAYADVEMSSAPSSLSFYDNMITVQPGTVQVFDTTYFTDYFLVPESYDDCFSLDVRNRAPGALLSIAPNPSDGSIRVTMAGATAEGSLVIFNTSGKQVYRVTSVSPAQLETGLDVNLQVVPGIYLLEVIAGDYRVTRKVIVQ